MAPEFIRPVRRVTFLMLALSAFAVEIAAVDTRPVEESLGLAAIWIAIAGALSWLIPLPSNPRAILPVWGVAILLTLGFAPFGVEPLRRAWTGEGYPLELQMVFGLRNVGLGLAALAGWLMSLRLAGVVSLFLTLFSAAMTNHPAVLAILGLYTAAGGVWLTLIYWTGLQTVLVAPGRAVAVELLADRPRIPWVGLGLLLLAGVSGCALIGLGPKRAALSLGELMPTSGGTGATDPFARYGVGDGPEEMAGDNAQSAGMVETEKMIEDNKNSLIDAVNDMYGPPHKPPKDQDRMIAAGKVDVIENHGKLPENRRPSREFDTGRQGPKGGRKPESQAARAFFEVEGRTPLHVRLVAYDQYAAGDRWVEARKPAGRLMEAESGSGDWMRLDAGYASQAWYAASERHRLKTAALRDNFVPTPTLVERFRINKVNRPDYYEWQYDGVLALAGRRTTPPGVVVVTDCRTVHPAGLPEAAFGLTETRLQTDELSAATRQTVQDLARAWAGDQPRGWLQIEAVTSKLRTEFTLDAGASAPRGHADPVLWFLTESRRGPDYLFATSAALMLRALDYPVRVCLGYYAAPEAFDVETAHTPVRRTDLHTWLEVRLQDRHWLVVEPTPGYHVLAPQKSLAELAQEALLALVAFAWRNAVLLGAGLALSLGVAWRWRQLVDTLATRMTLWWPSRTWRRQVRRVITILERRGRWAGRPRHVGQSSTAWLRTMRPEALVDDADYHHLTQMAEWAAYAPEGPPPWPDAEVATVCRRVLLRQPISIYAVRGVGS